MNITTHLFTSFLYAHYTAFPTALTHRYHLHFIAPFLFPLNDGKCILQDAYRTKKTGISNDKFEYSHDKLKSRKYEEENTETSMTNVQY